MIGVIVLPLKVTSILLLLDFEHPTRKANAMIKFLMIFLAKNSNLELQGVEFCNQAPCKDWLI